MNAKPLTNIIPILLLSLVTGCSQPRPAAAPMTLRVMTYNIHHGEGLDGKVDLLRIAELIKRERADIVALQEVDKGTQRTAHRDFPEELAALTGMQAVFSNNLAFQGGEYGNAVLTRFPIKRWTNRHFRMLHEGEQRGILQLVLDVSGREIVFMATHIDHRSDDAERWSNVGEIEELAKQYSPRSIILCGDFNAPPESRVCRRINETFSDTWALVGQGDGWTIPAEKPRKRIDYIWLSKSREIKPVAIKVPESNASDHLPVVAKFLLSN